MRRFYWPRFNGWVVATWVRWRQPFWNLLSSSRHLEESKVSFDLGSLNLKLENYIRSSVSSVQWAVEIFPNPAKFLTHTRHILQSRDGHSVEASSTISRQAKVQKRIFPIPETLFRPCSTCQYYSFSNVFESITLELSCRIKTRPYAFRFEYASSPLAKSIRGQLS